MPCLDRSLAQPQHLAAPGSCTEGCSCTNRVHGRFNTSSCLPCAPKALYGSPLLLQPYLPAAHRLDRAGGVPTAAAAAAGEARCPLWVETPWTQRGRAHRKLRKQHVGFRATLQQSALDGLTPASCLEGFGASGLVFGTKTGDGSRMKEHHLLRTTNSIRPLHRRQAYRKLY